jgi:hypothetical protein
MIPQTRNYQAALSKYRKKEKESQERRRVKPDSPTEERAVVFPGIIITRRSIEWL